MNMKKIIKRIVMTILFIGAMIITFQTISGVNAQMLEPSKAFTSSNQSEMDTPKEDRKFSLKSLAVSFKSLFKAESATTLISSNETVKGRTPKLEDAYDWSEFPARKVTATGYTAGVESTGKNPNDPQYGITYSGVKVKRDLYSTIAADTSVFPLGTILFIPGYGYGVVADTGSAIKGNRLDLYYETVNDVYEEWGKKTLDVYIVKMGQGSVSEKELTALNEDETMQVFRQQYMKAKVE